MKQALIVIDVQNDYFEGGAMSLVHPEQALQHIQQLERWFLAQNLPIIYIQHICSAQASFFRPDTDGVALHPQLQLQSNSIILQKHKPNSFLGTDLDQILQQLSVDQLVVTGMMTHMCIDSTTRAATELGYQPILIADATATCDLSFNGQSTSAHDVQTAFLAALSNFATIQKTHQFIQA